VLRVISHCNCKAVLRILALQGPGVLSPPAPPIAAHRGWCLVSLVQAPRWGAARAGWGTRFGGLKSVKFGLQLLATSY
jgi:hypothetical protein